MAVQENEDMQAQLLAAALPHVAFDGWSETSLRAACQDLSITRQMAALACPRGAIDLAIRFHHDGDEAMQVVLQKTDINAMKIREKITFSVRARLDAIRDKEAVRRGATLMALPQHAAEGAGLVWGTCDRIWAAIGDSSADVNWYTKRLTLSSVYSATVLYWLGDNSPNHQDTWTFLDRRIENVMQFEKFKAQVNANPLAKQLLAGPNWLLSKIKAPSGVPTVDLPGNWSRRS
ncbi:MAG: COQ9 family protein [Paracoccaceae bacterium]|jgi:ubiquinone biosynthesis protein COQ9|nr:COQ9 family protein [Marinovum sp.]MDA9821438.1 COQ9 family protein [Paracoccaceae bacterium]MBT4236444.1 COQ9 family protein [Marinovum sp.]MBT5679631.1 COQ9 family protein [Marinovum sp.]MDG1316239.1 COQ9 family protein [Paracoccaceae bacterium]|tara:strand:+ start:2424 stop:3122 length:699 start_codon:yes stop_codon:yes gene_type:complete